MPRIVLAAALLLLSGEVARADDFKTCASGAPDYAIMACTNLIEGGKLDKRQQAIAYTNRGVAFRIRGGVQRALADLNRAIELDSSLAPIYANRGLVYMYMGEPDPALADFNRALELDPNNPAFYLNRGAVYQRLKDKDRALADYTRAIELQPNNAMAYTNRGVLYELEGDHERAILDFDRAVELDPKLARAYANRGASYLRKGDVDRALADFDRAIELQPRAPEALAGRAQANLKKGLAAKALPDIEQALSLDPNDPFAHDTRAHILGSARPSQRSHRRIQEGARHQARSARELAGLERPQTRLGFAGAGEALGRLCLHEACGVAERSRHKLERKQPCRIHGAGQPDLTWRNRHEAEPAVIGHVPYEHDKAKALCSRTR